MKNKNILFILILIPIFVSCANKGVYKANHSNAKSALETYIRSMSLRHPKIFFESVSSKLIDGQNYEQVAKVFGSVVEEEYLPSRITKVCFVKEGFDGLNKWILAKIYFPKSLWQMVRSESWETSCIEDNNGNLYYGPRSSHKQIDEKKVKKIFIATIFIVGIYGQNKWIVKEMKNGIVAEDYKAPYRKEGMRVLLKKLPKQKDINYCFNPFDRRLIE